MLSTILPDQMQQLERQWMQHFHVPAILLMEEAARGVTASISRIAVKEKPVLFLCGPGANGGDGYAAARQWKLLGGRSMIAELSPSSHPDASIMRTLALQCSIPVLQLQPSASLPECCLIVDSLFGTGLSRPVTGKLPDLFARVRSSGIPVLAVDIPSGLSAETGEVLGCVMPAVETVTFHRPKQGFYLRQGPSVCGRITVHSILIPPVYGSFPGLSVLEAEDLDACLPARDPAGYKGTFGHIVILAGSPGMAGAGIMCARAALRAGAGLVTILCRQELLPIFQTAVPSAMCAVLPMNSGVYTAEALDTCRSMLSRATCAVIGCGIGTDEAMIPLLSLFASLTCPVIYDADALTLLARHPEITLPASSLLTPHPGEAARLLDCTAKEITQDPLSALQALHDRFGCALILKNACSLMHAGGKTAVQPFPSPALARGGSGDMLCGFLAAIISRRHESSPSLLSLQCAVYLHARAGLAAAEEVGEDAATCEDILRHFRLRHA